MVRKLTQGFMHWLRQLLGHNQTFKQQQPQAGQPTPQRPTPKLKNREIPTYSPQQSALPNRLGPQTPQPPRPQPLIEPPTPAATTNPNNTAAQERPRPPLNPASHRATNPSGFRVLLSNYKYPPSSDIQNLSRQLFHPQSPAPERLTPPATDAPLVEQPAAQEAPSPSPEKTPNQTLNLFPKDIRETRPTDHNTIPKIPTPRPSQLPLIPTERNNSHPTNTVASPESPAPPPRDPNSITKEGIVKLLFKIKKNNHHGYITPNDGSKDIIFHQKYIGTQIFAQLERGMAVEVTAHLTAGKAYADHIRIL